MRSDYLVAHWQLAQMDRREALRLAGRLSAAGALAALGASSLAQAAGAVADDGHGHGHGQAAPGGGGTFNDELFNVAAVLAGAWDDTAFYHRGDQRGTFQEVTPEKTEQALKILKRGQAVKTYNLGELMFNGFPAFITNPPRVYNQRLTVLGYPPPAGFAGFLISPTPAGNNSISAHEERFRVKDPGPGVTPEALLVAGTYQIATQVDNLNHIGVGPVFYGGHRGPAIAETWGTNKLGNENMGPIVTRGILLDILGLKLAQGDTANLSTASNGKPLLKDNYRITLEDIEAAMARERVDPPEPGDVVLLRTGWNQLLNPKDPANPDDPAHPLHPDHARFLAMQPGIYLREARALAVDRPAIIGADTWALEVIGNPVSDGNAFPVHQELLTHHGIRIGESINTDALAADGVYEFVFIVTPQFALGATAGNTPPAALGQPKR